MKHPAYPLRTNKAIDRYMLVEAAQLLGNKAEVAQYTYYGLGGPYLEDFRLMHEVFPRMRMYSFEEDPETFKRQQFHLPCSHVELSDKDFKTFLAGANLENTKAIYWIDYTGLEFNCIDEFAALLDKAAPTSLIKITVRANSQDYKDAAATDAFRRKFGTVLPANPVTIPKRLVAFAKLVQDMFQVAAQKALPATNDFTFQPIYSTCYADGVGMFSLCGILCARAELAATQARFREHSIANLNWEEPEELDVPFLTTKERLRLQEHLPCIRNPGVTLSRVLGYSIDKTPAATEKQLEQYARYYGYYPLLVKATP